MKGKKAFFLIYALFVFFILSGCGEKKFTEFRVYPEHKELDIARGEKLFITLDIEIPEKGHIYGNPKGPGTGKPTVVKIEAGSDFIAGDVKYLKPEKFYSAGETQFNYGYSGSTKIFADITAKNNSKTGSNKIKIKIEALLCDDKSCVPKNVEIEYIVNIREKKSESSRFSDTLTALYKSSRTPEELGSGKKVLSAAEKIKPAEILSEKQDTTINILKKEEFKPVYLESGITSFIQAIIFGIIAGFILNFMPCVLPVVSLKILGFVRNAGENRSKLRMQGISFAAGIMLSFAILAVLAAYFGYSWGALFQNTIFIVVMASIVFAFALSLFEVFTINPPSFRSRPQTEVKNSYLDAFGKGLFATLLATPCSGPFLGGTLAWALSQHPAVVFAIFISIGAGMSLPYILLTFNPGLVRFIPKPGSWTKNFENIMGFLLLFTVVYLLGIIESDLVLPMVCFLGFISAALWQFGKWGAVFNVRRTRLISLAAMIFIISFGYMVSFHYLYKKNEAAYADSAKFSLSELYSARDSGKISVVKFTADWCPNCRLVEKTSLGTPKVAELLSKSSVKFLTADITKKNQEAEELLKALGSRSIPFLAVFPASEDFNSPVCLRDIYSESDVIKAIEMAQKKEGGAQQNRMFDIRIK